MNRVIALRLEPPHTSATMTLKYMRAGGAADEKLTDLAGVSVYRMRSACSCRACYTRIPIVCRDDTTLIGSEQIKSSYLFKHLYGCREAYVFAATLGAASERLIRAANSFSSLNALALDAAGSAMVEDLCDDVNALLTREAQSEGKTTLRRYSPGYGDFPLDAQRLFTGLLNTPKHIGAYLTEGLMMYPTKTVTAIIGIKDKA